MEGTSLNKIVKMVEKICSEIEIKTGFEEDKNNLVYALLKHNKINLKEYSDLITYYSLDLPICVTRERTLEVLEREDWWSNYEHYSNKSKYLGAVMSKSFLFKKLGVPYNAEDTDRANSSYMTLNEITIAVEHDEYDEYLTIYKKKKLIANYIMDESVADFTKQLNILSSYCKINIRDMNELYIKFIEQHNNYLERKMIREVEYMQKKEAYLQKKKSWETMYERHLSYKFEDIYNINLTFKSGGKEKQRETEKAFNDYYSKQKSNKKNNNYNSYTNIFIPQIKEENKDIYKEFYRALSRQFHPDLNRDKDTTKQMQILNELKQTWGV